MEKHIKNYENYLKLRNLAKNTITIYTAILVKYLTQFPEPKTVTKDQMIQFTIQRGKSSTIAQTLGALNHFYSGVLNSRFMANVPRPKKSHYLPNILSEIEIAQVISGVENIKHESILQLIYSCALRISDAQNLKVADISKTKNIIKIVHGKGGKSAYIPIPEATKNLLRIYYKQYRPKEYLFEGQSGGKYSASSIRKIFNNALKNAKIVQHVTVHGLRHSRATHWLENGMDIKMVKELLRHAKLETTERYLHLTTSSLEKAMIRADNNIAKNYYQPILPTIQQQAYA